MKELNVIGTMQLLAACQKSPGVQHLVVKSTTTVYGASSRDPALFTEDLSARRLPKSGYAKDAAEIEGYVRGFTRRRPDVRTTLLRAANVIGPNVDSPITSYLRMPVVPTVLGFDPRLTFLHELDLIAVLRASVLADVPGTFNVAGDGVIKLSQALRRLGKPSVPVPSFALGQLGLAMRRAHVAELSRDLIELLTYGRGVDTTRMRTELGFSPRFSSAEALADFGATLAGLGRPDERLVAAVSALSGVDDSSPDSQEVRRG